MPKVYATGRNPRHVAVAATTGFSRRLSHEEVAAMPVQTAISRGREYQADRLGVEICGRSLWLASALEKIAAGAARIDNQQVERNPATADLFIVNPRRARGVNGLFSTHSPTKERVRRRREMAGAPPPGAGPWG